MPLAKITRKYLNSMQKEDYWQGLFRLKFWVIIFRYDFLMTSSVTSSEILIFSNLKLCSSILVSKTVSSLFKAFMFLRTQCAKLKMRELIIQGFLYWRVWGESPHQPKICLTPSTCKDSQVDHQHHPHSFTWKVNSPLLNKVT